MSCLLLSIRFLDGRYHGTTDNGNQGEWPPSPFRVFQALLAGNAVGEEVPVELERALEWLESLEPPTIIAPADAHAGIERLTYVLNNVSDTNPNSRTPKTARPTLLGDDRLLEYAWSFNPSAQADAHAATIARAARRVRALGWGIDLAIGNGQVIERVPLPAPDRFAYRPLRGLGEPQRRVPARGSLASLRRGYRDSLRRNEAPGVTRLESASATFDHRRYLSGPARPYVALRFDFDDDTASSYDPRDIKQLAGQLRHLCSRVAREAGVETGLVDGMILGHPKDAPRLSILPLPSIGNQHVDGQIRRVILAEPFGSDGTLVATLRRRLPDATLAFEGACRCPSSGLDLIGASDRVLRLYCPARESRSWASVTPVLLPGHNLPRRDARNPTRTHARAAGLLCRALAQAGIDSPAKIEFDRLPFWAGVMHVRDYDPRDKLAHLPRYHVRLRFERPLAGPLSIGAGRHVGFGTLAALEEV
jgi:CRISPR-associated protein Csb2